MDEEEIALGETEKDVNEGAGIETHAEVDDAEERAETETEEEEEVDAQRGCVGRWTNASEVAV